MATKRKTSLGTRFLTLFFLAFLAAGCLSEYLAARAMLMHVRARRWVEIPATIRQLDLESRTGGRGATVHRVACAYSYHYGGREYHNRRVGLGHFSSDNVGSWHQDTHRRLADARWRGYTVPCFVNPADPTQAVLDRELRFGLLVFHLTFATVFGGLGLVLTVVSAWAWWHARRQRRRALIEDLPPDQPWLADERWASGTIPPTLGAWRNGIIAAAVFWNLLWMPLLGLIPRALHIGNYLALLSLPGPIVGLVLIAWAVRLIRRHRRFGRSVFHCHTLPGTIGGLLRGDLVLAGDVAPIEQVEVALECHQLASDPLSRKKRATWRLRWKSSQELAAPPVCFGENKMRLPVEFRIPHSYPPTQTREDEGTTEWKLLVRAPAAGVDLAIDFDVPVFLPIEENSACGGRPEMLTGV